MIPARHAEATLPGVLDSVFAQEYEGPLEAVIADASEYPALHESLQRRYPQVKVAANPARTIGAGLNRAIAVAEHSIIVRCDAHSTLPRRYVSVAVETLQRTDAACVGGRINPVGTTAFGRAVALATKTWLGSGRARYRVGRREGPAESVYLGVFRREAVAAVGGFDSSLLAAEDYELNWRLRESGRAVWFDPALVADYTPRSTPGALARQYFNYGVWRRAVLARHPKSWKLRQLVPAALLLALGLSAVLGVAGAVLSVALGTGGAASALLACSAAVPCVYALTVLGGAAVVRGQRRGWWRQFAMVTVALVVIHIAWSAGFWSSRLARAGKGFAPEGQVGHSGLRGA